MNKKSSVILFLHGGPGLDSSYLKSWFDDLRDDYDLYFYNQDYESHGNGILYNLYIQLLNHVNKLRSEYNDIILFCHSWSNIILLKSIEYDPNIIENFSKVIFANPSSICWDKFQEFGDKLFSRIPPNQAEQIMQCKTGLEIMKLALPYYVGNPNKVPLIHFETYDDMAFEKVSEELENFDLSAYCNKLSSDYCFTIYCENDIENIDDSMCLANNSKVFMFNKAGHFPFAEYNQEYMNLLKDILKP